MQWQKWAGQIPSVVLLFGDQLDDVISVSYEMYGFSIIFGFYVLQGML